MKASNIGSKPTRRAALAVVAGLVTSASVKIPQNVNEVDDAQVAANIKTEGTQTRTALQAATVHGIQTPDDPIQTALNARIAAIATVYVTPNGNDSAPGTSWQTARKTLTAALSALPAAGGVIELSAGTHAHAALVNITKPVTIRGAGARATILSVFTGYSGVFGADANNVHISDMTITSVTDGWLFQTKTNPTSRSGWRLSGLLINRLGVNMTASGRSLGDGATEPTATGVAMDPHLTNCELTGFTGNETVLLAGTIGGVISNNHIHDCGTDANSGEGIKVQHGATGYRVTGNLIERAKRDGIDSFNSTAGTMTDNVIRDCGVWGFEVKWRTDDTNLADKMIVTGNRAERCGSGGFNLDAPNMQAIENLADACGADGFRFSANADGGTVGTSGGTFIGNVALNCAGNGFSSGALATDATWMGNRAHGNTAFGFSIASASVVMGNIATGNKAGNWNQSGIPAIKVYSGNQGSTYDGETRYRNNLGVYGYLTNGNLARMATISTSNILELGGAAASDAANMRLMVPTGGSIIPYARILPNQSGTLDLGAASLRFRNTYTDRVNLGGLWLRNNAGTLEKSKDGTTWSPV